jgi:hypothetical protein
MSAKKIFEKMIKLADELSEQMTEADEFVAIDELQKAIEKAKDVFNRTKDIE